MAQQQNQNSGGGSRHVRDVMTPNPATVSAKDSIRDAARIMASEDTGIVPVVDGRKIVGLVTDRDIVVRCVAEGKTDATINECMTKSVRSVTEDTPVAEVLSMMSNAQIRRVPLVNNNDELVGIVSIGDISTETNQDGKVGNTIEQISQSPANN